MERFGQLETQQQSQEQKIDGLLRDAKANAIPFEEAQAIQQKIAVLKEQPKDAVVANDIATLQSVLTKSIITLKSLEEFTVLLQKVSFGKEHMEQVLNHPRAPGHDHEAYCLLVSKEGNDYAYNAWEVTSTLDIPDIIEMPEQYQLPARSDEDEAKIKKIENDIRSAA